MERDSDLKEKNNPYRTFATSDDCGDPVPRYGGDPVTRCVTWFTASSLLGVFFALVLLKVDPYVLLMDAIREPVRFLLFVCVVSVISVASSYVGYNRSHESMTKRARASVRAFAGFAFSFAVVASETPLRTYAGNNGFVTVFTQRHAVVFLATELALGLFASLVCEYCLGRIYIRVFSSGGPTNHGLDAEASKASV